MTAWASCQPSSPDKLALRQFIRAFFFPRSTVFYLSIHKLCRARLRFGDLTAKLIKQSKWDCRLVWMVGGVGLVWCVGGLLVPPLLKSQLEKVASEELGRRVTAGRAQSHDELGPVGAQFALSFGRNLCPLQIEAKIVG